jgi:hypothetical protein
MKKFRYKKIKCANPDCGAEFVPSRANQFHCSEACRQRKNYVENKPETDRIRKEEIKFKKADKALGPLHKYTLKMKTDRVSGELFGFTGIEPSLCRVPRENPETGRRIHFIYNYGFEYDGKGFYIIHKMK